MSFRTMATCLTLAATAALIGTAVPAHASSIGPLEATGCASNVCLYLAGNAGGDVLAQGWARNDSFYGYFTLTGPNGFSRTSPTKNWIGRKGNYWSTSFGPAAAGTYCLTGNPGQGTACLKVS